MTQIIDNIKKTNDIHLALNYTLSKLEKSIHERNNNLNILSLATIDLEQKPQVRKIVLREFNQRTLRVRFHTDKRSQKFNEIKKNNNISLLGYDFDDRFQIRIEAKADTSLPKKDLKDIWNNMNSNSKECYSIKNFPGENIKSLDHILYYEDSYKMKSFNNFIAIESKIETLDLLFLHHKGHIRAKFTNLNDNLIGNWVAP